MTGRIVLSHVHVSTLRRTRSTEKLISSGLSSGGITLGPPLGLNSNIFLKQRINYSASRASENGM